MAYFQLNNSYVDVQNCSCYGGASANSRYSLEIPFLKTEGEEVVIIMLNPSSSARQHVFYKVDFKDLTDIDKTTNNVLSIFGQRQNGVKIQEKGEISFVNVKKVILLNLFPYFSPNQKELNAIHPKALTEMRKNLIFIDFYLRGSNKVFVGWGKAIKGGLSRSLYIRTIKEMKSLLAKRGNSCFHYDSKQSCFIPFHLNSKLMYVSHASNWK